MEASTARPPYIAFDRVYDGGVNPVNEGERFCKNGTHHRILAAGALSRATAELHF